MRKKGHSFTLERPSIFSHYIGKAQFCQEKKGRYNDPFTIFTVLSDCPLFLSEHSGKFLPPFFPFSFCLQFVYQISCAYTVDEVEDQSGYHHDKYRGCASSSAGIDIVAVKRSKVRELVNTRQSTEDRIFFAEIADTRTNDDGEEVQLVYKVALFALDFDAAKKKLEEFLKQGFDMKIVGLKCTKFVDVIY